MSVSVKDQVYKYCHGILIKLAFFSFQYVYKKQNNVSFSEETKKIIKMLIDWKDKGELEIPLNDAKLKNYSDFCRSFVNNYEKNYNSLNKVEIYNDWKEICESLDLLHVYYQDNNQIHFADKYLPAFERFINSVQLDNRFYTSVELNAGCHNSIKDIEDEAKNIRLELEGELERCKPSQNRVM